MPGRHGNGNAALQARELGVLARRTYANGVSARCSAPDRAWVRSTRAGRSAFVLLEKCCPFSVICFRFLIFPKDAAMQPACAGWAKGGRLQTFD